MSGAGKIFLLVLVLAAWSSTPLQAQLRLCGTASPDTAWAKSFFREVQEFRKNARGASFESYTIPVVIHILHNGSAVGQNENILTAQAQSQILLLNKDFSGTNDDVSLVPPGFVNVMAGNTGIQFCLAKIDKHGNAMAEHGIDRIDLSARGWTNPATMNNDQLKTYFEQNIKPNTIWDPRKYLNVWIADLSGSTLAGYATFPQGYSWLSPFGSNVETESTSGVVIHHACWGTGGTAAYPNNKGRIATHEIGHWLGLLHTFEGGCSPDNFLTCGIDGDYCCDTPPVLDSTTGCPATPPNTCQALINDRNDMTMNYMDYTNDACKFMFTKDQAERMQVAMSNGTFRAPLAYSTACNTPCSDLTILGPWLSSTHVSDGGTITVNFAEDNAGNVNAAPNHISFYLSEDNVLTPGSNGDMALGQYFVNLTLSPQSQTTNLSQEVVLPVGLPAGTYYIFVEADGSGVINECNEQNNRASAAVSVQSLTTPMGSQVQYRYWFDHRFFNAISGNSSGETVSLALNTNDLPNGIHHLNFQARDAAGTWSSVVTSPFLKISTSNSGNARIRHWMDNDFSTSTILSWPAETVNLHLDVSSLRDGYHALNFQAQDLRGA